MKFKNPSLIFIWTDRRAQSNMPLHLFQSLGHKNGEKANLSGSVEGAHPVVGMVKHLAFFFSIPPLLYPTKTSVKLWLNCLDCKLGVTG